MADAQTRTAPEDMKVTYTSANVDMDLFHTYFDEALAEVKDEAGAEHPAYIAGEAVRVEGGRKLKDVSPIDTSLVLGTFQAVTKDHIDQAVDSAKAAQKAWGRTPWQERVSILRQAAKLIRKRKFRLAAIMSIEVGKNRFESLGDAEESADLIDYYCDQMDDAQGFVKTMNSVTPVESNTDVLRPYGVFACIAPFNFPLALSTGMSSAALVAGNAVVYKPATDAPWTGIELYNIYRDAGVPPAVFQYVTGRGSEIGDHLVLHPRIDGVVFTGSKDVGLHIFHGLSQKYVRPCLMELGGKNPTIIMPTADMEDAVEGVARSAWGLQNQKCSACSRVYVHKDVADEFVSRLIERTKGITIGDPTERDGYFGPVIHERSVRTYEQAVAQAKEEGEILYGGERLTEGALSKGHFVAPCIAKLPLESDLFMRELFVPFLAIGVVDSLEQAIAESNRADYGLTAGIFSGDEAEIDYFFENIENGVLYVNKPTGSTTGAWPGAQPFCGWKGSGGSGKGGCGPYYVAQFMREQSRTVIRK